MAPRRHNHGHGNANANEVQGLQDIDPESMEPPLDSNVTRCCVPTGECLRASGLAPGPGAGSPINSEDALISLDDLRDTVRVTCNNDNCTVGRYMHRECFDAWEQTVLAYLKTCGRARSWSERQRHQNLWTKKGYDLAFKACGCKCSRGHLKKDLDWMPPPPSNGIYGRIDDQDAGKKKKRRNRTNSRPTLAISAHPAHHPNNNLQGGRLSIDCSMLGGGELRCRTGSLSSSNGSSSPPVSASSEPSVSPIHNGTGACKKSKSDFFSDRVRVGSGANGIFSRRLDFSSFNLLPRHKLNSYHIKMEDEGNHGNDDTRCFILSTLAAQQKSRVTCVLCEEVMLVFDRYPLVDGTFFLSPKQHAKNCVEAKVEGRTQYLTAVCMACLEGVDTPGRSIQCRFCNQKWDGSSMVLGTMYSYDIFAAMPCCSERHKCNSCLKPLLHPHQRLNYFSDYSHAVSCPYCHVQDTHFVKPLPYCYTKQTFQLFQHWP